MKYIMLVHYQENIWDEMSEAQKNDVLSGYQNLISDLSARGQYFGGNPLQPSSSATSIRVRDGRTTVTDGPYAETREQLGGYIIIDVADLDEAMRVAARMPPARYGTVEVRPIMDMDAHFGVDGATDSIASATAANLELRT